MRVLFTVIGTVIPALIRLAAKARLTSLRNRFHTAMQLSTRERLVLTQNEVVIEAMSGKKGRAQFVDLGRKFAANVPNSVPQLRSELLELVDPVKNPFFAHAKAQLFIANRGGEAVGRISAHYDELALSLPAEKGFGPGTGNFGYFDAVDEKVGAALLETAEDWLRAQGMTRSVGPISLSIWEEPGLLVRGQDHAPMIMMGHHPADYQGWIEGNGYTKAKSLLTYDLDVTADFPRIVQRIVQSGERNDRITVRQVDTSRWDSEVEIILSILNDAWSDNWGFVPFTAEEIAHTGKKLKPIIFEPLNMIAELDGEPMAFMLTFPDINDVLKRIDGKLFPFGWFHLLKWLRKPMGAGMRVPLMGVKKELHNSRLAGQLAFMMVDQIKREASQNYQSKRGEIGWILDDNQGMVSIADTINSKINREYLIYEKAL